MKTYLVGGAVRDMVLGRPPHDSDYVVFGATPEEMTALGFERVGKDFPVFLHPQTHDEYALARKEIKTGDKHTDFKFVFGPDITPAEDMQRRDFTCNALMFDAENNKIIDLVGGVEDIHNRVIRHVNTEHFIEDPLRVLRMCRFAAKLDFEIAPETMKLAQDMTRTGMLNHLTSERIWKEIESALNTDHFDKFIRTMRECGALKVLLPEVDKLWDTPERTDYHPEGNSGEHTMLVLQQGYNLSPKIKFALLLHDIGKIAISESILLKPGRLTDLEYNNMKQHPVIGASIVAHAESMTEIAQIIRHHHERYDGKGYPDRLSGEEIPIGSRIIAIADSIDAMTSKRCYRDALPIDTCFEEIKKNLGIMYDPAIGKIVMDNWDEVTALLTD